MTWKRMSERLNKSQAEGVLHEGIPEWMWSSVLGWINDVWADALGHPATNVIRSMERELQVPLDWRNGSGGAATRLIESMMKDHELALDALSYLLHLANQEYEGPRMGAELEKILASSGSAWRVAPRADDEPMHLERRVAAEVRDRYVEVAGKTRAGEHLRLAWTAMYGRERQPSEAYREAVRAVEAAGAKVISPANDRPTLGTMIRDFKSKPEKWTVPLGSTLDEGRAVLLEMMNGVWHGQHDRHGTPNEARPVSVSPPEAEAALHLSLTLVQLFTSGLVTRVT